MTSGGLRLTEDLGQEDYDFNDLFLYNSPGDDFPPEIAEGVYK